MLRYTLDLLKRIFPLRQRPKPLFKDRPCLNYDLGRCPGVCQQLISPQEYHKIVQKVAMIFQGCSEELLNLLRSQMEKAALELKFEQAATLRDQIKGLGLLNCEQKVALSDDTISRDAIALAKDEQHCCIQLFQIRAGKLVGRLGFFADAQSGSSGEIIQKVLEEHYTLVEAIEIPREIITQFQLPDTDFLVNWLSYRKNNKINIIVPQRKSKAELIEMVAKNAQYELATLQKLAERNYQALQDLANILELKNIPKRIEGYDISHIQGSNAVAAQVVFIDGIAAKQHYRHYKIKNPQISIGHSDDFRSLQEVIERRFSQYISSSNKYDKIPDLIIIDGGKGQLSAVVKVLQKINILPYLKVISLAKQREEIFIPGAKQPLPTNPEQPGVQLLRRVRDEAHRFAVSFHRQQRLTKNRRSHLDEIPGLGFQRQQKLLAHFHSIDYIREASLEQLAQVNGIGINLAQQIYNYFHPTVNN